LSRNSASSKLGALSVFLLGACLRARFGGGGAGASDFESEDDIVQVREILVKLSWDGFSGKVLAILSA
jgi:hypothetical protein